LGYLARDFPKNIPTAQRSAHIALGDEESVNSPTKEETTEVGEYFFMKRVLITRGRETEEIA